MVKSYHGMEVMSNTGVAPDSGLCYNIPIKCNNLIRRVVFVKRLGLFLLLIFLLSFCTTLAEEVTAGIWELAYYVDEFRMPTNEAYVCNTDPIEGFFSNSATTDSPLSVKIILDERDLAFVLYEYRTNVVKNSFSDVYDYSVILRDATGNKTTLSAMMPSGGDRLLFFSDDANTIQEALRTNPSVSFYIQETDHPTTNYLFTIEDTTGFSEILELLTTNYNERNYKSAVEKWEEGDYKQALLAFSKLGDYKDSVEWDSKYRAMMYEQAVALLESKDYAAANEAFVEAGNYLDAADRVGEPFYVQAEELLANGEYKASCQAFIDAGGFSDAKDRIGEPYYIQAEIFVEEKDYDSAYQAFIQAGDYKDAKTRASDVAKLIASEGETISRDSDADTILQLQKQLYALGLLSLDIEPGVLDKSTLSAVAEFQTILNDQYNAGIDVIDPDDPAPFINAYTIKMLFQ